MKINCICSYISQCIYMRNLTKRLKLKLSISIPIPIPMSFIFATKTNIKSIDICPPISSRVPDVSPCYVRWCMAYAHILFIYLGVHTLIVTILIITDCLTQLLIFRFLTCFRWTNNYESFIVYTNIFYYNTYNNTM